MADVEEVRARLALRALLPSSPKNPQTTTPKGSPEVVKAGVSIIVMEDFMSDSGASDKVLLKKGQVGAVKKINDAGHASIDFEEHKKLQWVAKGNLHRLGLQGASALAFAEDLGPSKLRQGVLQQLNDAFDTNFERRLARLERRFQSLKEEGCATKADGGGAAAPASAQGAAESKLVNVVADALRSRPLAKAYGPSGTQVKLDNPPEKDEAIVGESTTLRLTLQSLEQTIAARQRQMASLKEQVDACQDLCRSVRDEGEKIARTEKAMQADVSALRTEHEKGLEKKRRTVEELAAAVKENEESATRFRNTFHRQRRYLLQIERINRIGGREALTKHPTGDVFLVSQPLPFDEERPEVWDVGTAIANPYNVDSWPFEPNVLARRTFNQEASMDPFAEETEEDLADERRRFQNPFLPSLRLPRREDSDDDEYEDGYGGPTATSRSL